MEYLNLALGLLHAQSPSAALHLALEGLGGLTAIWLFASRMLPRLLILLLPWAQRGGAFVALWLVANPITGPMLRDPRNREQVIGILRGLLDLVKKLSDAFELEIEKDIAPPAAGMPPAGAPDPAPASPPVAQPNPAAMNNVGKQI
jgi:hypothetical protein